MRLFGKRFAQPGTSPGRLTKHEGVAPDGRISLIHFTAETLEERVVEAVSEALSYVDQPGVTWIDVVGLADIGTLERLGERLGLHSLALEDVLHTGQRPKVQDYEANTFVVLKHLHFSSGRLDSEQVSLFLGKSFVLTIQEEAGDDWEAIRARLRSGAGKIRKSGSDYLAYALIDAVIDQFFPILEEYGERIESLQRVLLDESGQDELKRIHEINHDLVLLRRAAWPHREVANSLERSESGLVRKETRVFLRDCYDHTIQILDILESYRDLARGLMDLHLSMVSNRMNQVMKVLTVMASIFIPLTFLAGIYGMNFDPDASPFNMPELRSYWGYPVFWLAMILIGSGMLFLFKRKNWW
ncbi:MAG: magnesium/cobalt transporter CorA [Acidobacteriota bacterium]|nr:magnesium/cobalt transporter CorA [Acidobacteriota bacterium]